MDYSKCAKGHLDVVVKDKVAVVTLNRPESLNSFGEGMHEALEEFLQIVNEDDDVNAAVITGAGRAFSSGGDVKGMDQRASGKTPQRYLGAVLRHPKYLVQRFINCEVPLIAAINGPAAGLGASVALLCDVTFMADTARIGDTHVSAVGVTAGDGGAFIWPHLVGPHRAKELLMSGRLIFGEEAARIGLVNYSVPADELMDKAMAYAKDVAGRARLAVRTTKIAVNKQLWHDLNLVMDFALAAEQLAFLTDDHKEAVRSWVEKRAPEFTGS